MNARRLWLVFGMATFCSGFVLAWLFAYYFRPPQIQLAKWTLTSKSVFFQSMYSVAVVSLFGMAAFRLPFSFRTKTPIRSIEGIDYLIASIAGMVCSSSLWLSFTTPGRGVALFICVLILPFLAGYLLAIRRS